MAEFRDIFQRTGRVTHSNPLSAPQGTAIEAKNWELQRDNVYRKIRGRGAYGSGLPTQAVIQLLQYKQRLIAHMGNSTLYYDSDGAGTFSQYSDVDAGTTFTVPEAGYLIQALESAGNLYLTTAAGIMAIESLAGTIRPAGVPQGLGFDLNLTTGTWLADNSAVAYRVAFSKVDGNSNTLRGAPSQRQEIINTSGGAQGSQLRIYIPDGITTSDYLELYRSSIVANTVTPPEDFQLAYKAQPTSAEITAGVMAVDDLLIDGLRGADL